MKLPSRIFRLRRRRGFVLPLALVFMVILLLLELSLYTMQQRAMEADLDESSRLAQLLATEGINANLADALSRGTTQSGVLSLNQPFDYRLPQTSLTLSAKWAASESLNFPIAGGWSTFDSLLEEKTPLPRLSFDPSAGQMDGSNQVSPGHTVLALDSSQDNQGSTISSTSHLFPYGMFAPSGSVKAAQVASFANPVYETPESSVVNQTYSGRPVDILAGQNIEVDTAYSSGRAIALQGNVKLPQVDGQNGAVPMSGSSSYNVSQAQTYYTDIKTLAATLAQNCVEKTPFFDSALFDMDTLWRLLKGDATVLEDIVSVGQACNVPFFPIPGMQDDLPFMIVFFVYHPFPPDFADGVPTGGNDQLAGLAKQLQADQQTVTNLQGQLDAAESANPQVQSTIDSLKGQLSKAQDTVTADKAQIKKISDQNKNNSNDIASKISDATVPSTAFDDDDMVTSGWSYFYILGELLDIVKDIIEGKNPFQTIETRTVHLGDSDPGWSWSDGQITMVANLSVPRGRTLQLTKENITVQGDVYLHPGSVLRIDGNLTIDPPVGWTDFQNVSDAPTDLIAFPSGRLIMEEGSSLIVSGTLSVNGGDYQAGSIMLGSDYGPNTGLTRLISADGGLTSKYGIGPGVEFGVLVDELGKTNSSLQGFMNDFFDPLTEDIAPQLAKLPYVGPWQWRKCWFANNATTFEFIPMLEEFGLGGPWPIPLPYDNCMRDIFKYVSIIYSSELNFFIGENLYTMSPFWVFGRGVSPVTLKVRPDLVADAVGQISWSALSWDDTKAAAENFLKFIIPDLAEGIVAEVIEKIVSSMTAELIPFDPVTCGPGDSDEGGGDEGGGGKGEGGDGDGDDEDNGEAGDMADKVEEFVKEQLEYTGTMLKNALESLAETIENDIYDKLGNGDPKYAVLRELPGVCVLSGASIDIGSGGGSQLASGLFVAQGDIDIGCEYTIGSVVSVSGDIGVSNFLHYPYFDRVSLYNPKKYDGGNVLVDSLVPLEDPQGALAGDAAYTFPRRLAEGWKSL